MKYVIIGASAAGMQAAEEIRNLDKTGGITVISKEDVYPYSRCLISRFVDGRLGQNNFYFKTDHFFKDFNVASLPGREVIEIDKAGKKVITDDKKEHFYDKLLIATGSRPSIPDIEGVNLKGVCTFYYMDDALRIIDSLKQVKKAVIAGAGFIGLEAAYALTRKGIDVTVIEKMSQILSKQTDIAAAKIIQGDLEELGVKFIFNQSILSIAGETKVEGVVLADKSRLQCGLLVLATGAEPNTDIGKKAGLSTGSGIIVDEYFKTSDPDIYAAGDVIEIEDIITGKREVSATWFNAVLQGKYAGYNMAGSKRSYKGNVGMQNAVQFHQIPLISYGKVFSEPEDQPQDYEVISTCKDKTYKKLILHKNKISGMIFVGDILKSGFYAALIRNSVDIGDFKERLLDNDFSYAYFKDEGFGQYKPYFDN